MDLSTTYMGMKLKNPIVPSSSPLSKDLDNIKRMEDSGAAAVVLWSLFEEQLQFDRNELTHFLEHGSESYGEALSYFPDAEDYHLGPEDYLEHIRRCKEAVDIPIIGSINGISTGGWTDYARKIEQAGADALELNIYFIPTRVDLTAKHIHDMYVDILKAVKNTVSIPVAVKVGPYFTSMSYIANRLAEAGADGLVLFNR